MTKLVTVNNLVVGNVLANTVNSTNGKVLLDKNVVLTAKHISLLNTWDIQSVAIKLDKEESGIALQPTIQTVNAPEYLQFSHEYDSIVANTVQAFEFIKQKKLVPIGDLKDTAGDIHSSIINNSSAIMSYLFMGDYKLASFISRHSVLVAYFAGIIARQMKWSEKDIAGVALASVLHDIGDLVIDKKEDSRTQVHIAETAGLLKSVTGLSSEVILGIVQHRERMNGSGVPTRALGTQIHPYAQVIGVADLFHNLAYTDEYVNPFPILDMLSREMYSNFNTEICQKFLFRVKDSLLFNKILLSDGQESDIIFFNENGYSMPVVKTSDNQIIDLAQRKDLTIRQIIVPIAKM